MNKNISCQASKYQYFRMSGSFHKKPRAFRVNPISSLVLTYASLVKILQTTFFKFFLWCTLVLMTSFLFEDQYIFSPFLDIFQRISVDRIYLANKANKYQEGLVVSFYFFLPGRHQTKIFFCLWEFMNYQRCNVSHFEYTWCLRKNSAIPVSLSFVTIWLL